MRVTRKQLANYIGINVSNVTKHYQAYLDALGTKRNYLTIFDIATLDNIPANVVCDLLHITDKSILKACETFQNNPN
ncbi:hypothetical protein A9Q86_02225 [Flavobacteriales bacterium 33_180_T64]|nr:hypothetical protein A9Q86_02225 [Flavobacteriales bacterium 33_180_T64]